MPPRTQWECHSSMLTLKAPHLPWRKLPTSTSCRCFWWDHIRHPNLTKFSVQINGSQMWFSGTCFGKAVTYCWAGANHMTMGHLIFLHSPKIWQGKCRSDGLIKGTRYQEFPFLKKSQWFTMIHHVLFLLPGVIVRSLFIARHWTRMSLARRRWQRKASTHGRTKWPSENLRNADPSWMHTAIDAKPFWDGVQKDSRLVFGFVFLNLAFACCLGGSIVFLFVKYYRWLF